MDNKKLLFLDPLNNYFVYIAQQLTSSSHQVHAGTLFSAHFVMSWKCAEIEEQKMN